MDSFLLSRLYIVLALINAKNEIFHEDFATMSELNRFTLFMQSEFNSRNLGVAITHELDREVLDISMDGTFIKISNRCRSGLEMLSSNVLDVLTDKSLLAEFFTKLENDRLKEIEEFSETDIRTYKMNK